MIHFKNTNTQYGFTIVELVVIIVVIGVLASIGVIGYGSWRQRVAVSEVSSDLNGAVSAMESARNFGGGYPGTLPSSFTASPGVTLTFVSGDTTNFCIEATSKSVPSITYFVKTSDNIKEPRRGTCADGVWVDETLPVSGVVTTLAGSGTGAYADGTGVAASFWNPNDVAVDSAGTIYVADPVNHRIRKITPAGVVTTLAGSGSAAYADGTGTAASFSAPRSIAVDSAGTIYVADTNNSRIRKITPAGVVTTLAGASSCAFADGTGTGASFCLPAGVDVDSAGTIYVADTNNSRIRKITPAGVVTTLAGSLTGYADGTGTAASFRLPTGIDVDSAGTVYVGDRANNCIRKITPSGVVTTFTGTCSTTGGYADGTGTAALFSGPRGITVDSAGTVYVADTSNNRIRKITPSGVVTTLAGAAYGYADGTGGAASFSGPAGIDIKGIGTLYIADESGNRIRKIR